MQKSNARFSVVDNNKRRLFETFENTATKQKHQFPTEITLPIRKTANSAGYDFVLAKDYRFEPNKTVTFPTDIKVHLEEGQWLDIRIRSSLGIKHGLVIPNCPVIDADYEFGEEGGNIFMAIKNTTGTTYEAKKGDRIAQGIIMRYEITDNDEPDMQNRTGGIGSTGK